MVIISGGISWRKCYLKMSKSFPEKMKNFFRRTESYTYNFDGLQVETFNVTLEMLKDISNESSTGHRLRTLKEIQEYVLTKKLADNAVEAIYSRIQDLVSPQQSVEIRHEAFNFYIALIQGQVEYMQIMRTILFRDIVRHTVPEDIVPRFGMLKALTDDGRNVLNFEIEMGYFLMRDFFDFLTPDLSVEFLKLVITFIKFNAAYVDEPVIVGFMAYLKEVCFNSPTVEVAQECLNLMEAILCYSHLPASELDIFLFILCVTVNTEALVESSWKQMRNILGTYKGVSGISSLCNMLKEMKHKQSILRGAVYFLGMALWDVNGVSALQIPPSAVLPSFAKVLETRSFVIAREVVLALTRLVVNREDLLDGRSLYWDSIFYIAEKIQNFPEFQNLSHPLDICVEELNNFLIACENKCRYEIFDSLKHLSVLLDNYSALRSDQSMIRLVSFRAESLRASKPNFIPRLNIYLEKYLKTEKRTPVLLEVLRNLKEIRLMNLRVTDEDVMDQVILQNLVNSDTFTDLVVRKTVVEFLIVLADSITSSLFLDVLDIIGKIMKRMLDNLKMSENEDPKDTYLDVITAVEGLIHVFKRKLFMMPPNHCVEIFHLLVKHMQQHYLCPSYAEDAVKVRKMILEFFFEIRANKYKQVKVLKGSGTGHSVYLMCDSSPSRDELVPSSPPPQSPSAMSPVIAHLGFDKGFQVIIACLKEEKDWRLLEMALKEIPILLQNKSLILRSNCSVGTLCSTMCQMVNERNNNIVEALRHGPLKFTRTELNGYIFPCAMTFTSYHSNLDSHIQRLLIRSLLSGLVSRSARNCIEGLTLCLLEMKNSMNKLLPDVLLRLSKISATKMVALPVLEFLSNLIRLPELYKTFVEDQYMSIFAIALPYTNPYKFNQYTVALAHHVLSMWYLKCRIPFRRDFAKFIMKGLRSNIDVPRSECKNTSNQSLDQGAKAKDEKNLNLGQSSRSSQNSPREDNVTEERTDQTILELHTELMETGLDLMTRFTFGMCSNQPERSPIDEFLLEKGQKTSWIVGNKIITITTSGSGSKTFKNGLCEVCYKATQEADKTDEIDPDPLDPDSSEDPKPQSFQLKKKRHRSAIQRRNTAYSEEISTSTSKTKDDIMLHYSSSPDSSAFARRNTSYVPDTDRFSTISHGSDKQDKSHPLCSCWITSWAEVHIRRPTGNTSWMTRMQNKLTLPSQSDVPLSILNSLILPQLEQELEICRDSPSESDAISLLESELTAEEPVCEGAIEITSKPKTTPPMRRTNSSPDMNTGWMSNLESKQSLLESSTELEKEEEESKLEVPSSVQPSALKQRVPDKSKSKNLKLDFAPLSHGHSSSKESGPTSVKENVRVSSIGQRQLSNEAQPQPPAVPFRDRGHTISVMSPNRPTGADNSTKTSEVNPRNGMSPSFVFLQLFQDSVFGITSPKPLLIPHNEANNRSLSVLDHIPPYDCHKIGVVYIGPDQAENEVAILSNVGGSARYVAFLRGLGRMVRLRKIDPHTTYLGGLDTRGEDGDYALIWHDDVMQVVFHEATLMKNKEKDKNRNEKKKHIANDCVMIAYNDSGADFNISTIKGQVTNACIVVRPEDFNCNVVTVSYRIAEMKESFGHTGSYLVSDESLAVFVRQMALHANLASMLISRKLQGNKYAQVSNWLERLRAIKRLRSKLEDDWNAKNADNYAFETEPSDYTDFTDYV